MATPANRPMTLGEWTGLLVLAGVWGGSFFFQAVALTELPVLSVVATRLVLGALILAALVRLTGHRMPRSGRIWAAFLGMGLLNNALPFTLIVWGQTHVAAGVASIIYAATPLFGVVLAHFLTTDERMTGNRVVGVLAGFAGVAVMMGGALHAGGGAVRGELACLAAAFCYACAGIFGRRFGAMGVAPLVTATGQLVTASLVLLPVALVLDRPWTLPAPGPAVVAALLALAAVSTAVAYVVFFRLHATAGATNLMLVTLLVPVSAVLLGGLFLAETLTLRQLAGMGLIGLGLLAIDGRAWAALRRRGRVSAGGDA
jgi:drug/metabolite transporter (DMT)-like permease